MSEDSPRIFVPPPLLTLGVLALGLAFDGRFTGVPETHLYWRVFAAAVVAVGVILIVVALGIFRKRGTRPEPWAPASTIVTSGLYRFTRNPMYLGMLLVYSGLALYLWSPISGLLLVPLFLIMNWVIIPREEAYLTRRFGEPYLAYRRSTRRWL